MGIGEFHQKTTTLNNAVDKLGYVSMAIAVVLKACHRTKDYGFIKGRHMLPAFTVTVSAMALQCQAQQPCSILGAQRPYLASTIKSLTNS